MKRRFIKFISYAVLILLAVISLLPILWMISTAFKTKPQSYSAVPIWIPDPIITDNFKNVWSQLPFANYLINSILVTLGVLVGQLVISALAAYGFARLKFPGRDAIFFMLLSSLMIPQIVVMIPQYIIIQKLNWIDTYGAVVIPQIFTCTLTIFLMRQHLLGIPKDFEEAAKVDGASILQTFLKVMLPQMKPVIATTGIMVFMKAWNNVLWPLVTTNSPKKQVLTVGLSVLQGQFVSDWAGIMAGATIALLPVLIIYIVAQKHFVESIYLSGIK